MNTRLRRCLYVTSSRLAGRGIDEVITRQLNALSEAGWAVDLVARATTAPPGVRLVSQRWNAASLFSFLPSAWYYPLQKRNADAAGARAIRKTRYNLVISWSKQALQTFRTAGERNIPRVLNCGNRHALDSTESGRRHWPQISTDHLCAEYRLADKILVASSTARASFLHHGLAEDKVVSIGRGADLDRFHPSPTPPERFRLLYCGRVGARKGIEECLAAWKQADLPGAEFWIAGDIPHDYRTLADNPPPGVHFLGFRQDIAEVMRQCSAAILLSNNEGMAKSLIEAAACGLPLIGTRETGLEIEDGHEGWRVERDNIAGIAERLRRLQTDATLRHRMGEQARSWALQHASWDAFAQRFIRSLECMDGARPNGQDEFPHNRKEL